MAVRYDLAIGLQKGHKVTKNKQAPRPSRRKGVRSFFLFLCKEYYELNFFNTALVSCLIKCIYQIVCERDR